MKNYTCENCKTQFKERPDRPRRFCSQKCNLEYKRKFPQNITRLTCKQCGTDFERYDPPSNRGTFEFCSPSCRNKARALPLAHCPVCGKLFSPGYSKSKSGVRKYCSQKCSGIAKRGMPSTNPHTHTEAEKEYTRLHYTTNGISTIIEKLGMSRGAVYNFARKIGLKIDKVDYSSMSERMKNNNPMKNPETAARVGKRVSEKYWNDSEYRTKLLRSWAGAMKKKFTKPELRCKKLLEEIGIEAEYQVEVKSKFIVDFRIGNIILQIDGEYWHGHPRFEPLTERQIKQRARDAAQTAYLIKCGYRVIRIWESEITKENIIALLYS